MTGTTSTWTGTCLADALPVLKTGIDCWSPPAAVRSRLHGCAPVVPRQFLQSVVAFFPGGARYLADAWANRCRYARIPRGTPGKS